MAKRRKAPEVREVTTSGAFMSAHEFLEDEDVVVVLRGKVKNLGRKDKAKQWVPYTKLAIQSGMVVADEAEANEMMERLAELDPDDGDQLTITSVLADDPIDGLDV